MAEHPNRASRRIYTIAGEWSFELPQQETRWPAVTINKWF